MTATAAGILMELKVNSIILKMIWAATEYGFPRFLSVTINQKVSP